MGEGGANEYLDVMQNIMKQWATIFESRTLCRATRPRCSMCFWPPSSLDCATLDYSILGNVESKTCGTPHPSVDALKASMEEQWALMSKEYVDKACKAFKSCLETMVATEAGHFEK